MPRFVILEHDHPALHWDFMLEADGVLRTWRLPSVPVTGDMNAEQLPDHRIEYLDYEGPVSGKRGAVNRWDRGTYRSESATLDSLEVVVSGARIQGRVRLIRADATTWLSTWRLDPLDSTT